MAVLQIVQSQVTPEREVPLSEKSSSLEELMHVLEGTHS